MSEQSDTPRTDAAAYTATDYDAVVSVDFARDLERALATATRERNEWEFAARNEAKLAQVVVRELDEARAEIERLRAALQRLACLGNGDRPGNSEGNVIAIEALAATEPKP